MMNEKKHNPDLGIFFLELFNVSLEQEKFIKEYYANEYRLARYEVLEYISDAIEDDKVNFGNIKDVKKITIIFSVENDPGTLSKTKSYYIKSQSRKWSKKVLIRLEKLFNDLNELNVSKVRIQVSISSMLRQKSLQLTQKLASYDQTNIIDDFFYAKYSIETDRQRLKDDVEQYLKSVYIQDAYSGVRTGKRVYFITLPFTYIPNMEIDNLIDYNFTKNYLFDAIDRIFDIEGENLISYSIYEIEVLLVTLIEGEFKFSKPTLNNQS